MVNEFTERIRTTIEEAKSMIHKAQDDMKRYYDRQRTLALVFNPGDKVFLDADRDQREFDLETRVTTNGNSKSPRYFTVVH